MMESTARWIVGVDPGRVNLGLCFYDRFTHHARVMLIDLEVMPDPSNGGRLGRSKPAEKHVFSVVEKIVRDFDAVFSNAHLVVVEKQMSGRGKHNGTREHIIFSSVLVAYLRGRGTRCIINSPASVRAFFGIRDGEYETNKDLSEIAARPFIGNSALLQYKIKTNKSDLKNHVDGLEALLMCIYAVHCEAKAVALANEPRAFRKNPRGPLVAVRAVDVEVNMDGGMAATALRKAENDHFKELAKGTKPSRKRTASGSARPTKKTAEASASRYFEE